MKWIYKRKFSLNSSRLFSIHFQTVNRLLFSLSRFMKKKFLLLTFFISKFLLLPSLFFFFVELLIDGRNTIQICWLTDCFFLLLSIVSTVNNELDHPHKKYVYSQLSQAWTKIYIIFFIYWKKFFSSIFFVMESMENSFLVFNKAWRLFWGHS